MPRSKAQNLAHKGFKYRIYPDEEQARLIRQNCGASRFVYNYALRYNIDARDAAKDALVREIEEFDASSEDKALALNLVNMTSKERAKHLSEITAGKLRERLPEAIKEMYAKSDFNAFAMRPVVVSLRDALDENGEYSYEWLKNCDNGLFSYALDALAKAFDKWKKGQGGFPKFKNRGNSNNSYTSQCVNNNVKIIDDRYVKLPKISPIKMIYHRPVEGKIKTATVSYTESGKYYVSLCCEYEQQEMTNGGDVVGIDVGIKEFYSDSKGNVVDNPKFLKKSEERLLKEQKRLSKMIESHIVEYKTGPRGGRVPVFDKPIRECKNIQKQRRKIAKLHEHIANQRAYLHDVESSRIAKENSLVCMETLNIKGMMQNSKLAQSIADTGWYDFKSKVNYKVKDHGGVVVEIPTFYPSSQLCSVCGFKNKKIKDLSIRVWKCPSCGAVHDRDVNAGKNILAEGLRILEGIGA